MISTGLRHSIEMFSAWNCPLGKEPGRHVFFRAGQGVLLIFNPEATHKSGLFPSHGAKGSGHAALGITADSLDAWRSCSGRARRLQIEKAAAAAACGRSLLFPRSGR